MFFQSGFSHFQQSVELNTIKWETFPDGWPNLFIEDVKHSCAGKDGNEELLYGNAAVSAIIIIIIIILICGISIRDT